MTRRKASSSGSHLKKTLTTMSTEATAVPKHRLISQTIRQQIESGAFNPGDRIPRDIDMVRTFGVSRPTVAKALQELERCGLVQRRAGSGTFVLQTKARGKHFGLLIPNLGETEYFSLICGEMARAAQESGHSLLWGGGPSHSSGEADLANREAVAWELCRKYIDDRVAGVFFASLELSRGMNEVNQRIVEAFVEARIPIVLLDRDYAQYPERSPHDLVGIDNRRVGFMMTQHLFERGCKRPAFLARAGSANTVEMRAAGFIDASMQFGNASAAERVWRGDPSDVKFIEEFLKKLRPDGIACANDITAAWLLQSLEQLGVHVPNDVMIIGVDDAKFAALLRIRLSSVRQPYAATGDIALRTMLNRIDDPLAPPQDILIRCELIARDSTMRSK